MNHQVDFATRILPTSLELGGGSIIPIQLEEFLVADLLQQLVSERLACELEFNHPADFTKQHDRLPV